MLAIKKGVDKAIGFILTVMMSFLTLCVVWQVCSRYVLRIPSVLTDEIARFLLIWVALLGSAYAVGLQKHLNIDLLLVYLPPRPRLLIEVFINAVIAVFSLVVIAGGGIWLVKNVLASGQLASAMQFPIGYIYLILPFSGIVMVFYSLHFMVDGFAAWRLAGAKAGSGGAGGE
ncbi:MAG: TRAP transporter small permease [Planctomycetota bacterium]|jgi:TRAP-type C4-dicarboxylate transport system permease small subunit|nr:TRAP transporter small permease [Planctomycetota bacterium]